MTEREWYLIQVVSGTFNIKCDHCPRMLTRRYEIIKNRVTDEKMIVGSGCSFELTGVEKRRVEPEVNNTDTGMPDWMMG